MSSNALLWPSQGTNPEERLDKYKWLRLPSQGFGGVGVAPPTENLMAYEPGNWIDAAFLQRIPLTINGGQVPTTQNDFPLLINDSYIELIGQTIPQLRFAGIDNVLLPYEIQSFNPGNGELIAWVKKPTVSDSDVIYIYFDNLLAVDEQNPSAVWSSGYKGVYHLDGNLLDSTSNDNDGTNENTTSIAGKIGNARDFNGSNARITLGNSPSLDITGNTITLSAWVQPTFNGANGAIIAKSTAGTFEWTLFNLGGGEHMRVGGNALTISPDNIITGELQKLDVVYDFTAGGLRLYYNGVLVGSTAKSDDIVSSTKQATIGANDKDSVGDFFNGIIDEARISDVAYTADYLMTEFNNQNDQSAFYTTGPVESVPAPVDIMAYNLPSWADSSFLQRIPLTINEGQVPTTQNDFSLLINGMFPDLVGEAEAEIRIGTDSVLLPYEIQSFNDSTGELIAWAKSPSVSDGNTVYVYFDNVSAFDEQDPPAVWDEYDRVWHLNEISSGAVDSTGNSAIGVETGGVTTTPGQIGNALNFTSGNKYITFPTLSIAPDITVTAWVNYPALNQEGFIVTKNPVNAEWALFLELGDLKWRGSGGGDNTTFPEPSINTWHKIVATQQGTTSNLYIDGVLVKTGTSIALVNGGGEISIGRFDTSTFFFYNGFIDHTTVQTTIPTADRVTTEFNNQNNPSAFYATGPVESFSMVNDLMEYET